MLAKGIATLFFFLLDLLGCKDLSRLRGFWELTVSGYNAKALIDAAILSFGDAIQVLQQYVEELKQQVSSLSGSQ